MAYCCLVRQSRNQGNTLSTACMVYKHWISLRHVACDLTFGPLRASSGGIPQNAPFNSDQKLLVPGQTSSRTRLPWALVNKAQWPLWIESKKKSRLLVRKPFKSVNLNIFEYWIMKWIWPSVSFLHFPGECWDGALQLLAEMPDQDLTAFGAAVSCCQRRWVEALQVLHDMQHGGELLVDYVDWGGWCCQWTCLVSMLCGVNSPAGQRDVEYKQLDGTVQNIPECFFQILSHPLFVGRTSAKPYCLQCCYRCLRKRQRVYYEVAKKKQREIASFPVENFKKDTTVAPACKWTTMNMLIPTKRCTLLLIREIYGNLSSITRGVSAAAGEQWQKALHLLKDCIEGKDCLSVATQQHLW